MAPAWTGMATLSWLSAVVCELASHLGSAGASPSRRGAKAGPHPGQVHHGATEKDHTHSFWTALPAPPGLLTLDPRP